jgi:hypothetical protein
MEGFSHFFETKDVTFSVHHDLNPKIWSGNLIKSEIKEKLLKNARAWQQFAEIPDKAIEDIILTGGNANYNYTPYSDLDVHIVIDPKKIPDCPEIIKDYYKDKKKIWSLEHDIKIKGYDVELYAQPNTEKSPKGQGIYSLMSDKWLIKPKVLKNIPEKDAILNKTNKMIDVIISFLQNPKPTQDSFESIKKRIKNMRTSGLSEVGEFSLNNIVFKELRNQGWLDRINHHFKKTQDKDLSLS